MAKDPVAALNKTQGESEDTADKFKDQVASEKGDMSKDDAERAVRDMLNLPQEKEEQK